MIPLALLLAAQQAAPSRGAEVFVKSCAVAFCHGPQGTAGQAPALAGRGFDRDYILRVTRDGVPRTSMVPFQGQLSPADLAAVVDYVVRLAPPAPLPSAPPAQATPKPGARPPDVVRGKELFFDATRVGSCGACHLIDGWGVAVGPDLKAAAPSETGRLREAAVQRVKLARPAGEEPFPALLVEQDSPQIRVYDLGGALPVLRTFAARDVSVGDGGDWSHAAATRIYSDQELETILVYLRWLASPRP